jgi:ABC-type multidrug transport system ATPase subunit
VLLLDDVISAVDAETSKHIVENCFNSPLMADRTIIIASHAVEALAPLAGHSVFLDDGKAIWTGTGPELLESEHMNHLKTESHKLSEPEPEPEATKERRQSVNKDSNLDFGLKEAVPKTPKQLIIEEQRAKGAVDLHHWRDLKRFNGATFFWSLLITMLLLAALAPVAERRVLE